MALKLQRTSQAFLSAWYVHPQGRDTAPSASSWARRRRDGSAPREPTPMAWRSPWRSWLWLVWQLQFSWSPQSSLTRPFLSCFSWSWRLTYLHFGQGHSRSFEAQSWAAGHQREERPHHLRAAPWRSGGTCGREDSRCLGSQEFWPRSAEMLAVMTFCSVAPELAGCVAFWKYCSRNFANFELLYRLRDELELASGDWITRTVTSFDDGTRRCTSGGAWRRLWSLASPCSASGTVSPWSCCPCSDSSGTAFDSLTLTHPPVSFDDLAEPIDEFGSWPEESSCFWQSDDFEDWC